MLVVTAFTPDCICAEAGSYLREIMPWGFVHISSPRLTRTLAETKWHRGYKCRQLRPKARRTTTRHDMGWICWSKILAVYLEKRSKAPFMINGFWGRGTLPPALLDVDVRIGSKSRFTIVKNLRSFFFNQKKNSGDFLTIVNLLLPKWL